MIYGFRSVSGVCGINGVDLSDLQSSSWARQMNIFGECRSYDNDTEQKVAKLLPRSRVRARGSQTVQDCTDDTVSFINDPRVFVCEMLAGLRTVSSDEKDQLAVDRTWLMCSL